MGVIIYVNEVLEAIRGKKLYSAWRSKLFEKCFWQKLFNNLKNPLEGLIRARYEAGSLSINPATPHCKVLDFYNYVCIIVYNTDNSLPVLLSSWNYGDKYAKYKSETISFRYSQICLLSQQKYNKTVLVW